MVIELNGSETPRNMNKITSNVKKLQSSLQRCCSQKEHILYNNSPSVGTNKSRKLTIKQANTTIQIMDNEVGSRNQKLDNPNNHSCTHDTNFDIETNFVDVTQMIEGENLTYNMEE